MASSSSNISEEPYKMQIVEMKSAAVYEKWWRRYNEYADGRSSSTNDVKDLHELVVHYEAKQGICSYNNY